MFDVSAFDEVSAAVADGNFPSVSALLAVADSEEPEKIALAVAALRVLPVREKAAETAAAWVLRRGAAADVNETVDVAAAISGRLPDNAELYRACVEVLAASGRGNGLRALWAIVRQDRWPYRTESVERLAAAVGVELERPLVELMRHPRARFRALAGLQVVGGPAALAAVEQGLTDTIFEVRLRARLVLAFVEPENAVEHVQECMATLSGPADAIYLARWASIRPATVVLTAFWNQRETDGYRLQSIDMAELLAKGNHPAAAEAFAGLEALHIGNETADAWLQTFVAAQRLRMTPSAEGTAALLERFGGLGKFNQKNKTPVFDIAGRILQLLSGATVDDLRSRVRLVELLRDVMSGRLLLYDRDMAHAEFLLEELVGSSALADVDAWLQRRA